MKKSKKLPRFWRFAIPIALIILVAGGGYAWYRHSHPPVAPTTIDGKPVNLKPATSEDKAQTDAHKDAIVQHDQAVQNSSGSTAKTITVIITGADRTTGRAYVSGVFEDGGTCTAQATMGSQTATANSVGFKNVSYTQCAPLTWDTPLTPGSWNITVNYKSSAATGSQTSTIEVK